MLVSLKVLRFLNDQRGHYEAFGRELPNCEGWTLTELIVDAMPECASERSRIDWMLYEIGGEFIRPVEGRTPLSRSQLLTPWTTSDGKHLLAKNR